MSGLIIIIFFIDDFNVFSAHYIFNVKISFWFLNFGVTVNLIPTFDSS